MHAHAEKTKEAIAQIRATRDHVSALLSDTPDFQTRAEHVFDTLANGLAFAIGEAIPGKSLAVAKPTRTVTGSRTIMGQVVPEEPTPMAKKLVDIQPSRTDVDKLREDVAKAYASFPTLSNAEIRNTLSDLELRGVAKAAGLQVTKTEPAHITDAFIQQIRTAMEEKANLETSIAEVEAKHQATAANEEPKQEEEKKEAPIPPPSAKTKAK